MARKTWNFQVDGKDHTVVLKHGFMTGKRRIWLDGVELPLKPSEARRFPDMGSRHSINIDNHELIIEIRTNGITFAYDLGLDGQSVTSGEQLQLQSTTDSIGSRSVAQSFSTTLVVASVVLGIGAIAANWYLVNRFGIYFPALSYVGLILLLLAGYLFLATEADGSIRQMGILEGILLAGLAIVLGALANYLITGKFF